MKSSHIQCCETAAPLHCMNNKWLIVAAFLLMNVISTAPPPPKHAFYCLLPELIRKGAPLLPSR